jgi:hypothetical protein
VKRRLRNYWLASPRNMQFQIWFRPDTRHSPCVCNLNSSINSRFACSQHSCTEFFFIQKNFGVRLWRNVVVAVAVRFQLTCTKDRKNSFQMRLFCLAKFLLQKARRWRRRRATALDIYRRFDCVEVKRVWAFIAFTFQRATWIVNFPIQVLTDLVSHKSHHHSCICNTVYVN